MSDQNLPDFDTGVPLSAFDHADKVHGRWWDDEVLVLRHRGQFFAVSALCPHAGAQLSDGLVVGQQIRCPWHHARFSLETGEPEGAPALTPLSCYRVEVADGRVRVTGKHAGLLDVSANADPNFARVLIVGGGAAGHACAEWLVRCGQGASVMLITDEYDHPYDRASCSKGYLSSQCRREELRLPLNQRHLPEAKVWRKAKVVVIDLNAQVLCLENENDIGFETLILATGTAPIRPNLPGFDRDNVFTMRTLPDADKIIAASLKARSVVILGADFIGMETAAAMRKRGLTVHVVGQDATPMQTHLGEAAGQLVRRLHEDHGVVFHMNAQAQEFDGRVLSLTDGTRIEADFMVLGVGVAPRIELAEQLGLELATPDEGDGIKVDGFFRTSAANVYAIGDVANLPNPRTGGRYRVEHWAFAQRQGQALARMLLGEQKIPFGEAPFFWTTQYDTSIESVGYKGPNAQEGPNQVHHHRGEAGPSLAVTFTDEQGPAALVTCNQPLESLKTEAHWDR